MRAEEREENKEERREKGAINVVGEDLMGGENKDRRAGGRNQSGEKDE